MPSTVSAAAWNAQSVTEPSRDEEKSLFREIWDTRIWVFWLVMAVFHTAQAMQLPVRSVFLHGFFADQRAGYPSDCQAYKAFTPQYCVEAHTDAVWSQAFGDAASLGLTTFIMGPLVGRLSDRFGRWSFLLGIMVIHISQPLVIALHETTHVPISAYFPFLAQGDGLVFPLAAAYVADLTSPRNRSVMLAFNIASMTLSLTVGPLVAGLMPTRVALWVSAGGVVLAALLFAVFVPESASKLAKMQATERQWMDGWSATHSLWQRFPIMGKNKLVILLVTVSSLSAFAQAGAGAMLPQMLQLKLGYSKPDLGVLFAVSGGVGFAAEVFIIRMMTPYLGERRMLMISTVLGLAELLVFCFGGFKGLMFLGVALGGLAHLVSVSASSILSKQAAFEEQGLLQGALYGVSCLMSALGPPTCALLFNLFTKPESSVPFFPGAPYLLGAVVMLVAILVTFFIDRTAEPPMEDNLAHSSEALCVEALSGDHGQACQEGTQGPQTSEVMSDDGADSFTSISLDDDDQDLASMDPYDGVDGELGLGSEGPERSSSSKEWRISLMPKLDLSAALAWASCFTGSSPTSSDQSEVVELDV